MTLYITSAQPNPPGRDAARGFALNSTLNDEWIEFRAEADRHLVGDQLLHVTFTSSCVGTGTEHLYTFKANQVSRGQYVRVHSGSGQDTWAGGTLHIYLNRSWFVWNNDCGDRVTLAYSNSVIDSASYAARPPEGVIHRVAGTDRLEPPTQQPYNWR